jgi:hypothetical protein
MCFCAISISAQRAPDKFAQIDDLLPTPNSYRTASGAPGHEYWQNEANYKIDIELDDKNQIIYGKETITYTNHSPDNLNYLWIQLDQNIRAKDSDAYKIAQSQIEDRVSARTLNDLSPTFDGGFNLVSVQSTDGNDLEHHINKTMMRITLDHHLHPGTSYSFTIKWWYNINDRLKVRGRSGYEYFPQDGNYLYSIAQFFPRMCMYNDVYGWQNKQFLGAGEFTLPFGNYDVHITVPDDHLVAATGELVNPKEVLSHEQLHRYNQARSSYDAPVIICNDREARLRERTQSNTIKTWHFKAKKVRDFAFASSRKFIWDAMAVKQKDGTTVMAQSMYPKEGNPLWEKFSTKVVAHALKTFSQYTFDFPYPTAWSIHARDMGMEYPMISFNRGRPDADGTYSERTKYAMISTIIHEIGHNYFPMIVNSDERQWSWMDEGITTFIQYLTEQAFERNYPSRRGPAHKIVSHMSTPQHELTPIMTNSESLKHFYETSYDKPAAALNILRETIMGRELFDMALKEYAQRWMFKHPTPADFFRTMEDASAVDLDWFWRGWFFSTEPVDISISNVAWFNIDSKNPLIEKQRKQEELANSPRNISEIRNEEAISRTYTESDPGLIDFYTNNDPLEVTSYDQRQYERFIDSLSSEEHKVLSGQKHYYELSFDNKGGLPMPIILDFQFTDGTHKEYRIPAEIWRFNDTTVTKVFPCDKVIKRIVLDPYLETADIDRTDNYFPQQLKPSRFQLYRERKRKSENKMRQQRQGQP